MNNAQLTQAADAVVKKLKTFHPELDIEFVQGVIKDYVQNGNKYPQGEVAQDIVLAYQSIKKE